MRRIFNLINNISSETNAESDTSGNETVLTKEDREEMTARQAPPFFFSPPTSPTQIKSKKISSFNAELLA